MYDALTELIKVFLGGRGRYMLQFFQLCDSFQTWTWKWDAPILGSWILFAFLQQEYRCVLLIVTDVLYVYCRSISLGNDEQCFYFLVP